MKRADGWTDEQPTKTGTYEVYLAQSQRSRLYPGYSIIELRDRDLQGLERDVLYGGALWREYVEPADPHAVTGAETGPWKSYRMSDDPMTPNLRLILDGDVGIVTLYEADMTSRSETAQETALHDKIIMSPADARWLRDQLNAADLSDPPEVRS